MGVGFELESQGFEAGSWIHQASEVPGVGWPLTHPHTPSQLQATASAPDLVPPTRTKLCPAPGYSWLKIPQNRVGRSRPVGQVVSQVYFCSGMSAWNHSGTQGFACLLGTKLL